MWPSCKTKSEIAVWDYLASMLRKYLCALCTGLLALHAPGPRLLVLARLQPLLPALLLLLAHQGPAIGSDFAGQSSCRAGEELQLNNAKGSRAVCIWRMQRKSFNHASCSRRCPLDAQYCGTHLHIHVGCPLICVTALLCRPAP